MSDSYDELPILFAPDGFGVLRFVDDVENGIACGCTCPDPNCGQALVARNGGTKLIHHFAHRRGGCSWSVDNLIVRLAADAISRTGRMAFPALELPAEGRGDCELIATARTLRVSGVELESLSGRGAPEIVVTCGGKAGKPRRFAVVVPLTHSLSARQVDSIVAAGHRDVVVFDLRSALNARKRELGRHFDRYQLVAEYQDPALIESILLCEDWPYARWERNARREAALEERKRLRAEEAKARAAAKAAEEEKRRREREERMEREKREREEAEARRRQAHQRLLEEIAEQEAAMRRREELMSEEGQRAIRAEMLEAVSQQEEPAVDALGRRWFRCELCGKVATEEEFSVMGGAGRVNLGKCRSCMMPSRHIEGKDISDSRERRKRGEDDGADSI